MAVTESKPKMTEKAPRIDGRKTQKFEFEYEGDNLEYEIQEPNFDHVSIALSQRYEDGGLDVIGAGKVIWERCCVAHSPGIESHTTVLVRICANLADEYALPADIEIKKK
jgi:hypothetical protein